MSSSNIQVVIKTRLLVEEEKKCSGLLFNYDDNSIIFQGDIFTFDHVTQDITQQDFYDQISAPMVENVKKGENLTTLAYGQIDKKMIELNSSKTFKKLS